VVLVLFVGYGQTTQELGILSYFYGNIVQVDAAEEQ